MKMSNKIGQLIEKVARSKNIGATKLGEMIDSNRGNVYNIYKRDSIDTELLKKIGHALEYDFFQHYIEKETIMKLKLQDHLQSQKVLVEIELTDEEILKIGFKEKVLKVLNKNNE